MSGRSASRTVSISMTGSTQNGQTSNFTVASASAASNTGFKTIDVRFSDTSTSSTVTFTTNGSTYFGNDDVAGGTVAGISGRKLWGEYSYVQVPATPSTPSISVSGTTITVSWTGITDWGDSSSGLGYRVELYQGTTFIESKDVASNSTSTTFTPASGAGYKARVMAYNELSSFTDSPMSVASSFSSTVDIISTYTVSYNSNGGSLNPSSVTVNSGSTVTLPSPGTRSGYSFNGWSSSDTGLLYSSGSTSHAITEDTTFTASWTQLTWTVTFNGNGGTTPAAQTVNQGSSITLPSSTRSGYTFNGWYTASSGGSFIGNANTSYTPSNSITIYAQWQALAPGFTDEIITGTVPININVNTLSDSQVVATNTDQYSLISGGGGTFPNWLSISNTGFLSGSTGNVGTYTFRVRATNTTSGQSVDSNVITIIVIYPGERATGASAVTSIGSAKRWNGSDWVPLTIMRRWNGSTWVNISN